MVVQYSGHKEQMYLQTTQEFHCGLVYDMVWDVCVCIIIREELINTRKPSSLNFYNWTDKM